MTEIQTDIKFSANHPSLKGHFPNNPIMPGVVILNSILISMKTEFGITANQIKVLNCKFVKVIVPPAVVMLNFIQKKDNRIDFLATLDDKTISLGVVEIVNA